MRRRLYDTGHAVHAGGTYVTCRHLVCAGSQAERGLTPSGRGTSAGADIAVTAISVPAVTYNAYTPFPNAQKQSPNTGARANNTLHK